MSTLDGLPAHILLVHAIVVLAPLTALLTIAASVWSGARRRLVWLIAFLALVVLVATPLTTEAGEWLEKRVPESAAVESHTELGDTMLYFAIASAVVALLLVVQHVREERGNPLVRWQSVAVVVLAVVIGAATMVQVYRIGDSGARASWEDAFTSAPAVEGSDE